MHGKIISIYIYPTAGASALAKDSVEIIAGSGVIGDRYYNTQGTFSKNDGILAKQEITFIESEEIDKFNQENNCQLRYGDLRRNVVTNGVRLNELVDKEFQFGELRFKGIELCEPCAHLAKTVEPKVLPNMIGKAGLRTQILSTGKLYVGDEYNQLTISN
ncbi:MAG: MOSC domain-containing protein [Acidiferrobacterales bacterium]|nr:MOSC domain-containing protein [Acidiferrobacterales bacterium]